MKWSIPERIIDRGRNYVNENRVVKITQNVEQQIWYADVLGSEVYHVELDGTTKEADICTCPYWQEHGYCKHTVATELALRKNGLSRVMQQNPQLKTTHQPPSLANIFTDTFVHLQEELHTQMLTKQALQIEVSIENIDISNYYPEKAFLGLNLKIGWVNERTYVIKNVTEFFSVLEKEEAYKVNSQHVFYLQSQNFTDRDRLRLQQYAQIHRDNQTLLANTGQVKEKFTQRFVLLPMGQAKEVIENLMENEGCKLHIDKTIIELKHFEAELPDLEFIVSETEDGARLSVHHLPVKYFESYGWLVYEKKIIELIQVQQKVYVALMQLLKRTETPEIFYPEKQLADLFAYVLPTLEKIGTVTVEDSVQSEMIHAPLEVSLTFMKQEKQLMVRVDFHYQDCTFSTDKAYTTKNEKSNYIVRNQKEEDRVVQLIKQYGYQKKTVGFAKSLPLHAELFAFFKEEIPFWKTIATVEVEDDLAVLYLDAMQHQPKVQVIEKDSWLDVRFDVSDIAEDEIDAIMASLLRKEKFHQLKNGQLLSLDSEEFRQTSQALAKLRRHLQVNKGHFEVPKYNSLQVNEAFQAVSDSDFSQEFEQMVADITHPENYQTTLPKALEATLRPYQEAGFRWLKMLSSYGFGGILADDMGLGKTVQTIAYILSEKENSLKTRPTVIVAPASLVYNWQVECQKFAPSLQTEVVIGNKQKRKELLSKYEEKDVWITSYSTIRQDIELYQDKQVHCLILDEAQMIKNVATKTFQSLKQLKSTHRFALSGTPIENNIEELWALFQMLMPGFFPPMKKFKVLSLEQIAKMIQPFVLRREKVDVLQDLPEKIETNLYSSLTEEQKKVYLAYLKQMQQTLNGMSHDEFKRNRLSILAGLTRLRQICCDPHLFIEDYQGDSGKLEQLKEMIQVAKQNKRRVLIFSQFTSMLSRIETELEKLGLSSFYLRGSTKPKDRMDMVEAFNAGEKDIFLISLKAGGTGLNLTGADTVILYDLWWNPAVEEQATGRAHRIGQKKVVEVWRMIAEGTIEEKMYQLQNEKRALFKKIMNAEEEQALANLTESDIREIFQMGNE